jgi:AcrR family transcriptional regulator
MKTNLEAEKSCLAIIDAAYGLFVHKRFHATSMREIAKRAGVSLGAIYSHFENKDQIFDQVLLEKLPYREICMELQSASGESLEDLIRNAAYILSREIDKDPDCLQLIFIELNEFQDQHRPILMETIYPQLLPFLRRIEGAQEQLRDLPPQVMLLSFLWILLAYYRAEATIDPDGSLFTTPGRLEHYLEIFLHGVLSPRAHKN